MPSRKSWAIEALNLQESLNAFKHAEEAFGATPLKECLMPIAERMRDYAKQRVSSATSVTKAARIHLRDLIFAAPGKTGHPSVIVGVDRKKAPHASLVEFGHGGPHPAPPHPFLRPAYDAIRRAAVASVGQEIDNRIIKKLTSSKRRLAKP